MMNELSGRTLLVTGAAGAVGSTVARRMIGEGARVRAMVRHTPVEAVDGMTIVRADLADPASLRPAVAGCDLVVHCAAELSDAPAACQSANVDGVRHLTEAMLAANCRRLVHLSSVSVYDSSARLDFDEDSPVWQQPLDVYGYTKAEGERLVRASGLAATILRPVLVLSMHPRSYWGPLARDRAQNSGEPVLALAEVPYVHVDNLVTAIGLAATHDAAIGRSYNVIDGAGDIRQYLAAVYAAVDRPAPPLPDQPPRVTYAGARIRRELRYAPVDRWAEFLRELSSASR